MNLLIRLNPALAERVRTVLAFLVRVYERCSYQNTTIPKQLQRPLRYLSKRLDRAETLTFVDMINFNWSFVESPSTKKEGKKRRFSLGRFERSNVSLLMRFLALEDEEQFWIQHVVIEAHSSNLIVAMKQWRDVAYHASRLASLSNDSSSYQYDWNTIDEAAASAIQRFGDSLGLLAECHTFGTNPRPDHVRSVRARSARI